MGRWGSRRMEAPAGRGWGLGAANLSIGHLPGNALATSAGSGITMFGVAKLTDYRSQSTCSHKKNAWVHFSELLPTCLEEAGRESPASRRTRNREERQAR